MIQFTKTAWEQLRQLSRRNQRLIQAALELIRQDDAVATLYLLEKESEKKRAKLLKKTPQMIWKIHVRQFRILCAVEGNVLVIAAIVS